MGFFDKVKASVGIGQPKLEIILSNKQCRQSELLKGKMVLEGKARECPIDHFMVQFLEIKTETEVSYKDGEPQRREIKKKQVMGEHKFPMNGKAIREGEKVEVDFEFNISHAWLSGHPFSHKLEASVDMPGLDPRASVEIFVVA